MNIEGVPVAKMTLDLKRHRFRIFKQTIAYLGYPRYIQFLINIEELYIAVLGSSKPITGKTVKKVNMSHLKSSNRASNEFYSAKIMNRALGIFENLSQFYSYHLFGEVDQINHVAYFYLSTLKKNERHPHDDE